MQKPASSTEEAVDQKRLPKVSEDYGRTWNATLLLTMQRSFCSLEVLIVSPVRLRAGWMFLLRLTRLQVGPFPLVLNFDHGKI